MIVIIVFFYSFSSGALLAGTNKLRIKRTWGRGPTTFDGVHPCGLRPQKIREKIKISIKIKIYYIGLKDITELYLGILKNRRGTRKNTTNHINKFAKI